MCTLTRLLCRDWARLHWRECTLGSPSTRASPVQMPLGYNSPHQDLLGLLYMHFSSQHSSFLMTSCPWSSALRMCEKLECNHNRMLTQGNTKQVTTAPAVGSWEQHWPGVIEHCLRQMYLFCGKHRLAFRFLPLQSEVRNILLDELTSKGNKTQRFVIIEVKFLLRICFLKNPLARIW